MNKKISLGGAIAFSAIVAAITFIITWIASSNVFDGLMSSVSQRDAIYQKLDEIDKTVRTHYIGDLDETTLQNYIARGYVAGTGDDYATYYSAEDLKTLQQDQQGYVTGIGITGSQDESGYIKVLTIYEGSPASAAGIESGDLIVAIEGNDVKTSGYSVAMKQLQGEAGTVVKLTVRHNGQDNELELTRQKMSIPTVSYRMIDDKGYVKISSFKGNTVDQFKTAIEDLQAQGAQGLIFDLRDNTGGTIDSVTKILDQILPEGTLGNYRYKDGSTEELGYSDATSIDLPMVMIANNETASASELFIADLKDYDKAKLVGTTTYGKGVCQTLYTLQDGSAVNITSCYFDPAKTENFNGVGITPDFEVKLSEESQKLYASGSLTDESDTQLQKAIEVLETETK